MGAEALVTVRLKGRSVAGKARLETDILQFRGGDLRLSIGFKEMKKVTARDGTLTITLPGGIAAFELGRAAAKWADKILRPPSRLEKIGAKPEWRASIIGVDDTAFVRELEGRVAHLSIGRSVRDSDAIFFGVTQEGDLERLDTLKRSLKPN